MNIRRKLDDWQSVTSSIGHLVSPLLYPSKSVKCVTTDSGNRFTRDAVTLLENLDIEHPVGQYVYDVCHSFSRRFGTGTEQLLYFISSWTRAAQLLCDMGIPSTKVVEILSTVIEGCIEHAESLMITVTDALNKTTVTDGQAKLTVTDAFEKLTVSDALDKLTVIDAINALDKPADGTDKLGKTAYRTDTEAAGDKSCYDMMENDVETTLASCQNDHEEDEDSEFSVTDDNTVQQPSLSPLMTDRVLKTQHRQLSEGGVNTSVTLKTDLRPWSDVPSDHGLYYISKVQPALELDKDESLNLESDAPKAKQVEKSDKAKVCQDDDDYIDGIKIVKLMMNNAESSAESDSLDEDISWFFIPGNSLVSGAEIQHTSKEKKVGYSEKTHGRATEAENQDKPLVDSYCNHIFKMESAILHTDKNSTCFSNDTLNDSLDAVKHLAPENRKEETDKLINHSFADTEEQESCDDLKNELETLKNNIAMDIIRVQQSKKRLKKEPCPHKDNVDIEFDSCFEQSDDEFDSCFDESIKAERNGMNQCSDSFSPEDEFKTIQLTFQKEPIIIHNRSDAMTYKMEVCKDTETESEVLQDNHCKNETIVKSSIERSVHEKKRTNCDMHIDDDDFDSVFDDENVMKPERLGTDCQKRNQEIAKANFSHLMAKPRLNAVKVDQGNSSSVKKSKLQDMDNLLKSLGKDTKSLNVKSLKIASRHLQSPTNDAESELEFSAEIDVTLSRNKDFPKPVDTSKLQDMDYILKSLGKDTKSSNVKPLKIMSRHLQSSNSCTNNEISAEVDVYTSPVTNKDISKQVVTSKLHDLDNVLKNLGKQKIGEQLHTKSGRIASRHLLEIGDDGEYVYYPQDTESVRLQNHETLLYMEASNQIEIQHQRLNETSDKLEQHKNTTHIEAFHKTTLENNSCSDDFNCQKINDLLKSLISANGSKSVEVDKTKFKSDILIRSRHFGVEAETEDVCRGEIADIEDKKGIDKADRRETVSQLVSRLNYGTDSRLVGIITEAVLRQSTEQTLSLLPAYVQTYTMTSGHQEPQLVEGLVLQVSHTQAEFAHRLDGRHCNMLIVNADITSTYKHKGYKPVKITRSHSVDTFMGHVDKRDQWTQDVTDTFKQLSVQILLARGSVSEDFQDVCSDLGVVVMEFVPYRQLSLLSEAARVTMVTYVTLATQENVCQSALLLPWQPDCEEALSVCVSGSCHHTVVISIPGASIQTVVLGNHSQTLVGLEEESLSGCLHRTGSALHDGLVLPGAGRTEKACHTFCLDMSEKLLRESQPEHEGEESQYLVTAYEVLADSFKKYHCLVNHNLALIHDKTPDCVYDDYRSKVKAWRTALDTVCTIMCSDYYIMTGVTEDHRMSQEYVIL